MFHHSQAEKGQGVVEFAIILLIVLVIVIAILILVGPSVGNVFSSAGDSL